MDALRYAIVPLTTLAGVAGFVLGGQYVWLGLGTFPVLLFFDIALPRDFAQRKLSAPWLADLALYLHAVLMVALYVTFLVSVRHGSNDIAHSGWQFAGSLLTIGWLSAVPNLPVAHELMHRRHWFPREVSRLLGTMYGDPNRDISHVRTHHLFLDTPRDTDTPYRGEIIYTFVFRASMGSYTDAIHAEAQTLRNRGISVWNWRNRTYLQVLMLLALPGLCLAIGGPQAMLVCVLAVIMAKALVEAFNYFQHYGLLRVEGGPVLKHHAWNHLGAVVRPLGVEITNHINHHLDGYTKFYLLKPEPEAPQMPSLFLCFLCALIPPLWMRLIARPRLRDWDRRFASPAERALAAAANARAGWPNWFEPVPNAAPAVSA